MSEPLLSAGAPRLHWLEWDGHVLRWRLDAVAGTPFELLVDGTVFERRVATTEGYGECRFEFSPSGQARLEFGVTSAGAIVGAAWRVCFGAATRAGEPCGHEASRRLVPLAGTPQLPRRAWHEAPGMAVVVPVHDAPASVARCLAALAQHTPAGVAWVLIDDASADPAIAPLLARYAARPGVRVERQAQNAGYTRSVNAGIALAGAADVVLLNSDTEVGPLWLQALRAAAYSDDSIGTVTAVSDNAGAFSVPELEQYCPPPARWTLAQAQRAVLQQAGLRFPELPTGNGFCMYVKRALIDRIGVMDATAFPCGYGEENDFCQRAVRAGFRNVIAGNVLVRHERSASFGDARRAALGAQGMAVLRARYPSYEADVGATLYSFERRVLDYRVRRAYSEDGPYARVAPRRRILAVGGGAQDDATASGAEDAELFTLKLQQDELLLRGADPDAPAMETWSGAGDPRDAIGAWLLAHAIEALRTSDAGTLGSCARAAAAALGLPCLPPGTSP